MSFCFWGQFEPYWALFDYCFGFRLGSKKFFKCLLTSTDNFQFVRFFVSDSLIFFTFWGPFKPFFDPIRIFLGKAEVYPYRLAWFCEYCSNSVLSCSFEFVLVGAVL